MTKGFATAAWFDLASLDENKLEDEASIMRAVEKLHDFIDEETSSSKVSSAKTILAGFSQGGALAMYSALTYHKKLAGVFVMSSWPIIRHTMPDVSTYNGFLFFLNNYVSTIRIDNVKNDSVKNNKTVKMQMTKLAS